MIWRVFALAIVVYVCASIGREMWAAYHIAAKEETPAELVGRIMAGDGDALKKDAGYSPTQIALDHAPQFSLYGAILIIGKFFDPRPLTLIFFLASLVCLGAWVRRAL